VSPPADKPPTGGRGFFEERLNIAWIASGVLLVVVVILTPDHGWGTGARILAAVIAIGLSGAARIRDGRRDRERKGIARGKRRP
jgi:lysylphosphatidylglycerol synthetase-like protein (DUF2156 family)